MSKSLFRKLTAYLLSMALAAIILPFSVSVTDGGTTVPSTEVTTVVDTTTPAVTTTPTATTTTSPVTVSSTADASSHDNPTTGERIIPLGAILIIATGAILITNKKVKRS